MTARKATPEVKITSPAQLSFLVPTSNKRKTRMVSIRVDEALLDEFQEAASKADAAGYELSMTNVVHGAIRMAIDQTKKLKASASQE